ncbi:hypothetical protein TrVFT333_011560 [Trichoderma virens FT-333]|nr:hypothetical protein TrVFT333_011560 [Trichoderma virens FT-333]
MTEIADPYTSDALNERREKVILGVIHGLYTLKTRLCDDETSCSFECSSISLGALYKAMKKMNLTDTPPSRPYPGLRLETLVNAVFFIRDPSWKSNCRCLSAPATSSSTTTTKTSTTTTTPSTAPLKKTAAPPPAKAAPVPSRPLFGGPPLAQPTNTAFTFHPYSSTYKSLCHSSFLITSRASENRLDTLSSASL